jgi:cyclopentanol dehydrogenase
MGNRVAGKVAFISGGARGIGASTARLFVKEGANVVVGDVRDTEGQKLIDQFNSDRKRAAYVHLDVSKADDWEKAIATAEREFGVLHILVNNAGVLSMVGVEETEEVWQKIIDINQKGVWLGMKLAVPALRRAGGGSMINISSIYGLIGSGAATAYQASKGAVRLLTKTAAIQFALDNIRVNSVHPGITATPMVDELTLEARKAISALVPLKREARPEEIAYGILFLASDESSYITGSELVIDGGYTTT